MLRVDVYRVRGNAYYSIVLSFIFYVILYSVYDFVINIIPVLETLASHGVQQPVPICCLCGYLSIRKPLVHWRFYLSAGGSII